MAIIHPSLQSFVPDSLGEEAEYELLSYLKGYLPDTYEIFFRVDLSAQDEDEQVHNGEIDFIVMNGDGQMLAFEVKTGPLFVQDGRLYKNYKDVKHKDILSQFIHQRSGLRNRLNKAGLHQAKCTHFLALRDYVLDPDSVLIAVDQEQIIDANRYGKVGSIILQYLHERPQTELGDRVRHLLMNMFDLQPMLVNQKDSYQRITQRLADGLATWVPRISSPSRLYHIDATAGSGKTQLALRLLNEASNKGLKSAYICFNRPLADRMAPLAPIKSLIANFDDLCVSHYRRTHGEPDFTQPGLFATAREQYMSAVAAQADSLSRWDVLVIDEAQDFEYEWLNALIQQVSEDATVYLMQDDDQRLYPREPFELDGPVKITCDDNFRSPREVVAAIKAFGLSSRDIVAKSPVSQPAFTLQTYDSNRSMIKQTEAAIRQLQQQGFAMDDIVVLAGCGKERSAILQCEQIGPYPVKKSTGQYDRSGNPLWTEGDVLVDTVYRFKGQSAPAVIITDFDYEDLDEKRRRLLFVAMTRASMALYLLVGPQTEKVLTRILSS